MEEGVYHLLPLDEAGASAGGTGPPGRRRHPRGRALARMGLGPRAAQLRVVRLVLRFAVRLPLEGIGTWRGGTHSRWRRPPLWPGIAGETGDSHPVGSTAAQAARLPALQIDRALMFAYGNCEQPEPLLKIAERLLGPAPMSRSCRCFGSVACSSWVAAMRPCKACGLAGQGPRYFLAGYGHCHPGGQLGRVRTSPETALRGSQPRDTVVPALHALAWYAVVCQRVDNQARDDALKSWKTPRRSTRPACWRRWPVLKRNWASRAKPWNTCPLQGTPVRPFEWPRLVRPGPAGRALSTGRHRRRPLPQGGASAKPRADDVFPLAQQRLKKLGK